MSKDRGIFLVTTMFMILVVVMILAAIVRLVPSMMSSAGAFSDLEAALAAAQAGVRYAASRLQEDFRWRADTASTQVVNQSGLVVVEDRGNVFGFITSPGGQVSQFRLRFNYHDGSPGQETLDDPTVRVSHPFVSVNNLTNQTGPVGVPRSNGAPNWNVPAAFTPIYDVAPRQALLIVQGLAGDGLRGTSPANPDPASGSSQRVVRRYVETTLAETGGGGGDAVLSGGGNVELRIASSNPVSLEMAAKNSGTVKVRAKDALNVFGGGSPNVAAGGKSKGAVDGLLTDDGTGVYDEDTATVSTQALANPPLMTIEWSSLTFPDSSPSSTTAAQLKAGIYYWNDTAGQLEWFDEAYTTGWVPTAPGLLVSTDFANVRTDSAGKSILWENAKGKGKGKGKNTAPLIEINGDINIQPGLNTDGVYFVSENSDTSTFEMKFDGPKSGVNSIYTQGDFYVQGPLQGRGTSVIAGGEITVTNGGVNLTVNPNADSGINMYAKGDITLSTNVNGSSKGGGEYADMKLAGLIYTWSDFNAYLDNATAPSGKAGKFELTGALAAFGGDPSINNPGDSGSGNLQVYAGAARLTYDPAYTNAVQGATSGELSRVTWSSF